MGHLHTLAQPSKNGLSALEFALLNDYQRGFPLEPRPYAELARRLEVDEATVIDALRSLQQRGVVSRIGAVFRPNVVGVSALAALAVPTDRLAAVAALVSAFSEVNHNYEREHRFNLWFVATAASANPLHALFQKIEVACGCGPVLVLPLLEQFHIDLGFGLGPTASPCFQPEAPTVTEVAAVELSAAERAFMAVLQHGLPFLAQPYAALGWPEAEAIDLLSRWSDMGVIKRFGVVVRHQELGYTANAMVVWDVPDGVVSQLGKTLAASGQVSLCYRRPRQLPHWPFNLFCMVHGKDRDEVMLHIAALVQTCGMAPYPRQILFSTQRFKQCGARYVADVGNEVQLELTHGAD